MYQSMAGLSIVDKSQIVKSSEQESNSNRILRSVRANLLFPVGKVHRSLKQSCDNGRAGAPAAIFCAAVLEYLTAELMQSAGCICKELKEDIITHRHLKLVIKDDAELKGLIEKLAAGTGSASHSNIYKFLLSNRKSGANDHPIS